MAWCEGSDDPYLPLQAVPSELPITEPVAAPEAAKFAIPP